MPLGPDTTQNAPWSTPSSELFPDLGGPLLVAESDLAQWLTAQFQTWPGCEGVIVEAVIRLEKPDEDGCNWSRTLFLNPNGVSPLDYGRAYAGIVDMARKAFNLKETGPDPLMEPEGD